MDRILSLDGVAEVYQATKSWAGAFVDIDPVLRCPRDEARSLRVETLLGRLCRPSCTQSGPLATSRTNLAT